MVRAPYVRPEPPEQFVREMHAAITGHEVGCFMEVPYAGPFTAARYEIVGREVNARGFAVLTCRLVKQ
jgi:hypothetical protein